MDPLNREDYEALQTDLLKLGEWESTWQIRINVGKCKEMHTGTINLNFKYMLMGPTED